MGSTASLWAPEGVLEGAIMSATRRLRFEIYADVLWAIHSARRSGDALSMYRIERIAGLTHVKLRSVLDELHGLGLLNGGWMITERGYTFLYDMSNKVVPVFRKYGLWDHHL